MKHKFSLLAASLLVIVSARLATIRPAQASPSGTWSPAGSMATPRGGRHTATLLLDGKVLVAGGLAELTPGVISTLDSAELYDPTTNSWSTTASMSTPRSRHTATLLLDGRVLVAGGRIQFGESLATAELYDPSTGTWSPTGSMTSARDNFKAVLLSNGRVLVMGGVSFNFPPKQGPFLLKSAEIYDPQTGTWSAAQKMSNARLGHEATLLADGRVLVTAGANSGGHCMFTPTAEVYDPQSDSWTNTIPMSTARGFHVAALLADGSVLVAGGWALPACFTATATAEVYDPVTNRWSPIESMNTARGALAFQSTQALLLDGRVLVSGGFILEGFVTLATAELYDPAAGTWSATASMSTARADHTSTRLADGRMLVAGGYDDNFVGLATAEVYTP